MDTLNDSGNMWRRVLLRLLLIGLGIVAIIYCIPFLWKILGPFVISLAIAASLQPAVRLLQRIRIKRGISSLVLVLLLFAVVLMLVYWFASFVVRQAINALNSAPQMLDGLNGLYLQFREKIMQMFKDSDNLQTLDTMMSNAYGELSSWATNTAGSLVGTTFSAAVSVPTVLIYANFLILSAYFLTRDYTGIFPKNGKNDLSQTAKIRRSAVEAVSGYLRMQVIYTIFVLVVSVVGFTAFSVPYGFLMAALAALLEFLPLFGNGTLYVPTIILLFLFHDYRNGVVVLVVHLILYLTRKVTEPRMMNRQMGLNPIVSLLSMYIGIQTGGVVGLTLAPIVMVVLQTAWRNGLFDNAVQDFRDCGRWIVTYLRAGRELKVHEIPEADAGRKGRRKKPAGGKPADGTVVTQYTKQQGQKRGDR